MSIRFWCARCGRSYLAADEHAGKNVRCKTCAHVQKIPSPIVSDCDGSGDVIRAKKPVARRSSTFRSRILEDVFRAGARESSVLQGIAPCLVALSAADLFVTYCLLQRGGGFYESNPVARWFFSRWNIAGMALYKFAIIGGVVAIAEVIERHRRGWGRAVLLIGCVAAAGVVIHGLRLLMGHEG